MDEYRYDAWDAEGNKRDWYCEDVLTGKAPIDRVYEDDLVLAFHHPRPEWPMHFVVIPKAHTPSLLGPEALNRNCSWQWWARSNAWPSSLQKDSS